MKAVNLGQWPARQHTICMVRMEKGGAKLNVVDRAWNEITPQVFRGGLAAIMFLLQWSVWRKDFR